MLDDGPNGDTCFLKELNETEQAIIKTLTFLENNAKTKSVIYQTTCKFVPISRQVGLFNLEEQKIIFQTKNEKNKN